MYKLPGIKPRPSTSGQRNILNKATSRKRIKRVSNGKDKIVKSRVIFNNHMIEHKENNKVNQPANVLFSLKNLNLTSKNIHLKFVNALYWNEEPSWLEKNNKSFDDASKLAKQRNKIKKARDIAKNQIINPDTKPQEISEYRLAKLLKKETQIQREDPLANHNIQRKLRSRMIDWMVECFAIFNKKNETFFLAASKYWNLIDIFLIL